MKFVKIRQLNRPPSFQDAFAAMRQERAGYAQSPTVEAAYEAAAALLETGTEASGKGAYGSSKDNQ